MGCAVSRVVFFTPSLRTASFRLLEGGRVVDSRGETRERNENKNKKGEIRFCFLRSRAAGCR